MTPLAAVLAQADGTGDAPGAGVTERAGQAADDVAERAGESAREAVDTAQEGAQELLANLPTYAASLLRIAVVLVLAFVVNLAVRRLIKRFEHRHDSVQVSSDIGEKRAQTLGDVLRTTASAVIWGAAILMAIGQAGINLGPLVAAAGIGGIAIGFGAQSLVRDVISGFFVLLEDQFHVGDVVSVAGVSGVVEKLTLRTTVLRDLEGRRHVVPNGEIRVSTNFTKDFSRYLIPLPVPYEADVDAVVELVRGVADDMRRDPTYASDILGPLTVLGVDDYGESQVVVKVYVETLPGRQWDVGRELRRRIKRAFDESGISIPYPHREVIVRNDGGAR